MRIHDGAYGTLLEHHLHGDETVDDLSVRAPALVTDAHRAYLDAGADVVQTNGFLVHLRGSARRRRLLRESAHDCAIAAATDHPGATVAWTIGPAGDEPRAYWESIEHALDRGVGAVLCETITSAAGARAFLAAWAEVAVGVTAVQVLLACSIDPSDRTGAAWLLDVARDAPAEVLLGLNCCTGPVGIDRVLASIVEARGTTWAMPSAGIPTGAPLAWPFGDPTRWAGAVAAWGAHDGIEALGGCCGTSPESIAALVQLLDAGA